jgi:hypothetical protein
MPESIAEYDPETTRAALSVLLDLFAALGEYRDHAVLVGGWVPFVTCNPDKLHCGSKDIDIAFNSNQVRGARYEALSQILVRRGFAKRKDRNSIPIEFSYERRIERNGKRYKVQLDLLAQEQGGTRKGSRHQKVGDVLARKAKGADLAVGDHVQLRIQGELPSGAKDRIRVNIAKPMPYLVMKAFAMQDRAKEKDAYDIYWICKYHPDGRKAIAEAFSRGMNDVLVQEALEVLRYKFGEIDRVGPTAVANFLAEDFEMVQRDAFETVQDMLREIP